MGKWGAMMQFLRRMILVVCFLVTFANLGLTSDTAITVDVGTLIVPEGGTATFQVRLSAQPISTVHVTVSWVSGDSDIRVESGSNLIFTTANWNMYQTVTLRALRDVDMINGSATIRLSAPGIADKDVVATELDNGVTSLKPPQPPRNLRIISQ